MWCWHMKLQTRNINGQRYGNTYGNSAVVWSVEYYKVPTYLFIRITTNCHAQDMHFAMYCLLCVVLKSGHVVKWIRNTLEGLKRDAGEGWRRWLDRSCEKWRSVNVEWKREEHMLHRIRKWGKANLIVKQTTLIQSKTPRVHFNAVGCTCMCYMYAYM